MFDVFILNIEDISEDLSPKSRPDQAVSTETNAQITKEKEELSTTPVSAVEFLRIRREKIEAKKAMISELVSSILEDPQTNVCSRN